MDDSMCKNFVCLQSNAHNQHRNGKNKIKERQPLKHKFVQCSASSHSHSFASWQTLQWIILSLELERLSCSFFISFNRKESNFGACVNLNGRFGIQFRGIKFKFKFSFYEAYHGRATVTDNITIIGNNFSVRNYALNCFFWYFCYFSGVETWNTRNSFCSK